jgi:hypothetical protein
MSPQPSEKPAVRWPGAMDYQRKHTFHRYYYGPVYGYHDYDYGPAYDYGLPSDGGRALMLISATSALTSA